MDELKKGKVYFVGAGPGASDLITVRGSKLLSEADIIIYAGSLVNPELLKYAKNECKIFDSSLMTLDEVITLIDKYVSEGYMVVRLHTGDQSIYGAVREQMDRLDELGILYESCPGVSAAFGAAATLNLEYTLPGISQSLIITRMEGKTKVPPLESIESFASHKTTMAIYLSIGLIKELSQRLVDGGYQKSTPAIIIYKATWPDEKVIYGTVGDLEKMAKDNNIKKTALILIGDVLTQVGYELSRLYAPDFSTEYRKAKVE